MKINFKTDVKIERDNHCTPNFFNEYNEHNAKILNLILNFKRD